MIVGFDGWPFFTSTNSVWSTFFVEGGGIFWWMLSVVFRLEWWYQQVIHFCVGNIEPSKSSCQATVSERMSLDAEAVICCSVRFREGHTGRKKQGKTHRIQSVQQLLSSNPQLSPKMSACILMPRPSALPKMASSPPLRGFFSALPTPKVYSSCPHLLHISRSRHT